MKFLNLICILLAFVSVYSQITEVQIDNAFSDCHDSENHPINQLNASSAVRVLQDYYTLDYLCDGQCALDLETFIDDLIEINDLGVTEDEKIRPCNEYWDYESGLSYDADNLDTTQLQKYITCLYEMAYLSIEEPYFFIFECTAWKIEDMLNTSGAQIGVIVASDIEECEVQCETDTGCSSGTECFNYISDNFDLDQEFCSDALDIQNQDYNNGLTLSSEDFTNEAAEQYISCIYDNIYLVKAFSDYAFEIDWEELYETADESNDYQIDYTIFDDLLSDEVNAVLTLECQAECYDEWKYMEPTDYEYYDNSWVFEELYGEEFWDSYDGFEEIEVFWDEDTYSYVDCKGDDCIDENGNFTGEFADGQENPCDSEYCFVELFGCIEKCSSKFCPKDTCYEKAEGQSFDFYAENICKDLLQLSEIYEAEDIFELNAIVPVPYIATFKGCMTKLKESETNSSRDSTKKGVILGLYDCMAECVSEDTVEKENNPDSQSRLLVIFSTLLVSCLLLL